MKWKNRTKNITTQEVKRATTQLLTDSKWYLENRLKHQGCVDYLTAKYTKQYDQRMVDIKAQDKHIDALLKLGSAVVFAGIFAIETGRKSYSSSPSTKIKEKEGGSQLPEPLQSKL